MLQQVGRYKILSQLGQGAMGIVYLADDPMLNRQVAVKTIDLAIEDAARREFLRVRLLRDARAAASLSHPNIVGVYDVVVEGDCACVVMEYIAGEDLASYLSRNRVADSQFTVHVIRAMAAALDYTHSRGIIHRDIKPANVMLDSASVPKITDFGIARITEGATTTMTGTVMGTIEYMAPEQVKGEMVDGRADQFALGVVAYRMLTGGTLYGSQSMATLAYKIVNEQPQPVRSRNSSLSAGVDPVVAKALAKAPDDRYRNCSEFAAALATSLAGLDREATTVAMPVIIAAPPRRSGNRTAVVAIALAAAAGAIAGLVVWWKPWATPAQPIAAVAVSQPAAESTPPQVEPKPAPTPTATVSPVEKPPVNKTVVKAPQKTAPTEQAAMAPTTQVPPPDAAAAATEALNRGQELMKQQQYAAAVQAFTKVADLRPAWGPAYVNRGSAYQRLEQFDAAIRDYSRAIRINPELVNAYIQRGQCYIRQQQDDLALEDLNHAIGLKQEAPLALVGRAGIYLRRKEYRKALADYDVAIRLSPALANAYRGRATARRALGDRPGARADDQKYVELSAKKGEKGG